MSLKDYADIFCKLDFICNVIKLIFKCSRDVLCIIFHNYVWYTYNLLITILYNNNTLLYMPDICQNRLYINIHCIYNIYTYESVGLSWCDSSRALSCLDRGWVLLARHARWRDGASQSAARAPSHEQTTRHPTENICTFWYIILFIYLKGMYICITFYYN